MQKTTIALLTAAALGTSGLAAAQMDGPNFSGRVDIRFNDVDGSDLNGSNASSKLAVSGGSDDAIAGLSTFYYGRIALRESTGAATGNDVDYIYTGFEGDFGRVSFGIDDDLVYKYVGAYTDLYRGVGPATDAIYSSGYAFGEEPSVQYSIDVGNFSAAAYADTGVDGANRTQLAASADVGPVSVGAAFADSSDRDDSEAAIGGSVDAGIASLRATYIDRDNDTKPVHVAAVVPLNNVFTATVGYGDIDNAAGDTEVNGMLMADLGGGLDLNLSVRDGDTNDGVSAGVRYSF